MSDETKTRKQYKFVVLNSDSSETTEARINDAAAEGFTVEFVVPGYQRGQSTWNYAALIMSKDPQPARPRSCSGCADCRGEDFCMEPQ